MPSVMRPNPRLVLVLAIVAAACGSGEITSPVEVASTVSAAPEGTSTTPFVAPTSTVAAGCADVVAVEVEGGDRVFTFAVTVSSNETGWDKYADRWEVRDPDGAVLGVRELAHPHETEQPFTRSLTGVRIPGELTEVVVVAHDSVLGFCGMPQTVTLPAGQ